MSRLDAVAEALGIGTEEAKQFTRAVRAQFEAAPSYAQILRALRDFRGGRPSPQQVAASIKQFQAEGQQGGRRPRGRTPSPRGRPPRRGRRPR